MNFSSLVRFLHFVQDENCKCGNEISSSHVARLVATSRNVSLQRLQVGGPLAQYAVGYYAVLPIALCIGYELWAVIKNGI